MEAQKKLVRSELIRTILWIAVAMAIAISVGSMIKF